MTTFANWCLLRGVPDLPAAPADVAQFVADCAPLGVDIVWALVQEISSLHCGRGLADPTLGGPVASAINTISGLEPPRSWRKEEKLRFHALPYDLQTTVLRRDEERERARARLMSEADRLRNELAEVKNGIPENAAA
jgi:hypothetical protein